MFHALVLKNTLLGSGAQCPLRMAGAFGSVSKIEHPEGGETESQVLGPGLSLSFRADSVTCTVLPALPQSCRAHLQMDGLESPALLRGLANRPACSLWSLWHWSLGSSRLTAADFHFCPVAPACEHHSQGWLPLSLHLQFLHSSPVHSSQQQHCCPAPFTSQEGTSKQAHWGGFYPRSRSRN